MELTSPRPSSSSSGLYLFGDNSEGNLGNGDIERCPFTSSPTLLQLKTPVRFVSVAAGLYHSLALSVDGRVWSWGRSENGRLGLGHNFEAKVPTVIEAFGQTQIAVIAAGYHHSMALSTNSQLFCWGSGWSGQLGTGTTCDQNLPVYVDVPTTEDKSGKLVRLAAGYHHSLALADSGRIYSWGYGEFGQLGHGPTKKRSPVPKMIESPDLQNKRFIAISASENHSVGLTEDGHIFSWGHNRSFQLGHESTQIAVTSIPTQISTPVLFSRISTGSAHTVALSKDGKIYYWGRLMLSSEVWKSPQLLQNGIENLVFSDISSRVNHCLALTKEGEIWSFGYNEHGQCGQGHTNPVMTPSKTILPEGVSQMRFKSVVAGGNHSLALAFHESLQNPINITTSSSAPTSSPLASSASSSPTISPLGFGFLSSSSSDDLRRSSSTGRTQSVNTGEGQDQIQQQGKRISNGKMAPLAELSENSSVGSGNSSSRSNSPRPSRIAVSSRPVSANAQVMEVLAALNRKEQELRAERESLREQQKALDLAMAEWARKDDELAAERQRVLKEAGLL